MREIGAFEAKTRLSQLLEAVEAGEEIMITRRGKPIARLVPAAAPEAGRRAAAFARIAALRKAVSSQGATLTAASILEARDDGRR